MARSSGRNGVNAKQHFPFLDLPAELRLLVYEHLLVGNEPWRLAAAARNKSKLYPNIIAICQLAQQEATPVLYGFNQFEFTDELVLGAGTQFLNNISNSAQHISSVNIDLTMPMKKEIKRLFVLLKNCAALSTLTIGVSVWASYKAEAFAKAIGPLVRLLHKNQQKKHDLKTRDVLDGLNFTAQHIYGSGQAVIAEQARHNERAATFEKQVKDLLRATFK